ncbi:hypothetical protein LOK49_LG03G00143 [Camellia lanceoleosa]|uniref:Uncharacterized protein n=1 Tax=Camellia lanceoleosa TaxID=1840588 RepID=A0ACC0I9X6_9ERIC|nr:hypothetical protein LOK49_LG03G00143 [Camellia lanceoleosa]
MVFHRKLVPKKKEPARLKAKGVEEKALVNETAAQKAAQSEPSVRGDFSPSKKQTLLAVSASMKEDLKKAASANAAEQDLDAFKTRVFGIKTASDR